MSFQDDLFSRMFDRVQNRIGSAISIVIDEVTYSMNATVSAHTSIEGQGDWGKSVAFTKRFSFTLPGGVRLPIRKDVITYNGFTWYVQHMVGGLGDDSRIDLIAERAQAVNIGKDGMKNR